MSQKKLSSPPSHESHSKTSLLVTELQGDLSQEKIPDRFIFVHSYLDEAGLDVYEFRVLSHVARRVGATYDKEFFASLKKSAAICQMSVRKMQYCLKVLCDAGFLDKSVRDGRTDIYKLKHPKNWASPSQIKTIRQRAKGKTELSEEIIV